jgi:tetratricopeptide (TPR) repeat protein
MKRTRQPRRKSRPAREPASTKAASRRTPIWVLALVGIVGAVAIVAGVDAVRTLGFRASAPELDLTGVEPAVAEMIAAARQAVNDAPESAPAWGNLGMVLMAHGRNADAVKCLTRAAQLDPTEPRWPYLAATAEEIEPEAALANLRAAVACAGEAVEPELLLAERLLQVGRLKEAEQHFGNVRQRAPDHPRWQLGLGRLQLESGRLDEARRSLRESAKSPFSRKASWELLAEIEQRSGNAAAARQAQAKAAASPPDAPWPDPYYTEVASLIRSRESLLQRVEEYHRQGRPEEGRVLFNQLARAYPDVYFLALGRRQAEQGELAEAEQSFRKAAELAPEWTEPWLELAGLLLEQKQAAECDGLLRRVTELEPAHAQAWRLWGRCALLQEKPEEARRRFETALQYAPHDAAGHRELADLLSELEEHDDAEVHRNRAEQLEFGVP